MQICPLTNEPTLYLECLERKEKPCRHGPLKPSKPHSETPATEYQFGKHTVRVLRSTYASNDGLAVIVEFFEDGFWQLYGTATVNLDMSLAPDEAFVDVNNIPKIDKFFAENGLAKPTGFTLTSGFCKYPLMKFDLGKIPETNNNR